ncbi:morphogenetic protein [Photobacterium phosphoreum]|uniref:hypothetical protein n=1 Tax=Photobacterium phosphoreum TaxID=659 RepID=UPI001E30F480|nr:hypothetical protein [Photobacterium phosphoreum]MCD9504571.1 morphogenetic protein [Photobacterium phosphoreum]
MKTTPMIFNTEMVKTLLAGKKTVTRRPVKQWVRSNGNWALSIQDGKVVESLNGHNTMPTGINLPCNVGDLIWVRETFQGPLFDIEKMPEYQENSTKFETPEYCIYAATDKIQEFYDMDDNLVCRWRPSIHMPRWASRITLKVTDVRCEKISDLTEEQAIKEGMLSTKEAELAAINAGIGWYESPYIQFKHLWEKIYNNWSDYVWVIEFEVINENIDKHIKQLK